MNLGSNPVGAKQKALPLKTMLIKKMVIPTGFEPMLPP